MSLFTHCFSKINKRASLRRIRYIDSTDLGIDEDDWVLACYTCEKPEFSIFHKKFKIMITNDFLFIMKDNGVKDFRRKVPIAILAGISKKAKKESLSLVVHIYGEADEFFYTEDRDDIIDLVKRLYWNKKRKNLPIFIPSNSKLGDYWTTLDESEKGLTRMPARKHAIATENIYIEVDESVSDDTQDVSNQNFWNFRIVL
jgi:hypothetical protein